MKRYSLWVKSLVFFLAVVTLLCVAVSGLGILAAESQNMYAQDDYEEWIYDQYRGRARDIAFQVLMDYSASLSDCPQWLLSQTGHADAVDNVKNWCDLNDGNWCYTIQKDGNILRNTHTPEFEWDALRFIFEMDSYYPVLAKDLDNIEYFYNDQTGEEIAVDWQYEIGYQVDVYISRETTSYYLNSGLSQNAIKWLFDAKYPLVAIAAGGLILFAVAFILLMCLAGKNPRTGEANPRALNRLPLDLYLAASVGITVLGIACVIELLDMLFDNDGYNVLLLVLLCGCGVIVATADIGFFTALAAQFKVPGGFWWRHSLCGRVLKLVWKLFDKAWGYVAKGLRKVGSYIRDVFGMLPVIWKWIVAGGALGIVLLLICATTTAHWYSIFPLFVWCLVFACLMIYCGYSYGILQKGIKRMKAGDLSEKIPTQWLFGSFKQIAEDLNALSDVVTVAAEKQMKAERMKTELITNVSHDIKTPLTSVINYVDLLQQPHTQEEGEQYLEVLSRQSQRLKKLVEDLMDMSKASSGNVAVNLTQLDAVEAVNQALGEFADKLEAAKLTPVFRSPDSQLHMLADGRLTWRVLSNILSNVVKYALPGTRVYIDLLRLDKSVVLSVKNISREELNISAEELTERFVRGDASRNTEGSGLGLNIAESLMRLQRGSMELTVDGDLFKVTLIFPAE